MPAKTTPAATIGMKVNAVPKSGSKATRAAGVPADPQFYQVPPSDGLDPPMGEVGCHDQYYNQLDDSDTWKLMGPNCNHRRVPAIERPATSSPPSSSTDTP